VPCRCPLSHIVSPLPLLENCCPPPYRLAPRCPQRACNKSASAAAMVTPNSCCSDLPKNKVDPGARLQQMLVFCSRTPPTHARAALYQVQYGNLCADLVPEKRQETAGTTSMHAEFVFSFARPLTGSSGGGFARLKCRSVGGESRASKFRVPELKATRARCATAPVPVVC
jgi:hypothetical protein